MEPVAFGIFCWDAPERQTNRYGSFYLGDVPYSEKLNPDRVEPTLNEALVRTLVGQRTRLICEVVETRVSEHIGDRQLQVYPSTPAVGEMINLGVGIFVVSRSIDGTPVFYLVPEDGRSELWMDPRVLYRLHSQTVKLYVYPTTEAAHVVEPFDITPPDVIVDGVGIYAVKVEDPSKVN